MSTVFLKNKVSAQDRCPTGRTCLTAPEMDYFLRRDAKCYKLEQDSVETAGKIDKYKINEAMYKANESDLNSQISTQKTLANNYKTTAVDFQIKYTNEKDKASNRGKLLIGSIVINIGFVALGVVLLRL